MTILSLGLALFLALHVYSTFRSRDPEQDIKRRLGEGPYMGLYSLGSAVALGLMIWGYLAMGPGTPLYEPIWPRHASLGLMVVSTLLVISAYAPPNHIRAFARHPMVLGIGVWSLAHMLRGPDLRAGLLFSGFGLFALINYPVALRRPAGTSRLPTRKGDMIVISATALIFTAFIFWLHALLFGVALV